MKVKKVTANNRKKAFEVVTTKITYAFPYSKLTLKPTDDCPIVEVSSDSDIGNGGFTYRLKSGEEDTILMDQILEYAKDPEYLRIQLLFKLTIKAKAKLEEGGLIKREIIRRMGTTPTQFYRLLDQTNTHKTIDQMIKLLSALDCAVDVTFSTREDAAA